MIAPDGLSDLVRSAQTRDREAETKLLKRIQPELDRFARRFGHVSTAAESTSDLAQEASLRLWERFQQFQGAADDESTAAMLHDWLQQLVRRLAANRHAARHADKRRPDRPLLRFALPPENGSSNGAGGLDMAGTSATPSVIAQGAEAEERVRRALEKIPDTTDRLVLEMCFLQAHSLRAIAEHLNISYDKVRERYHAGLQFLESELKGVL
jgi:RNA polymerase sigma factor (sigma-70 family)